MVFINPTLAIALIGCLLSVTGTARADCEVDASDLYASFKKYRDQINRATKLEQLTAYFSTAFNRYYTGKLENPELQGSKKRYLTQYWDNLNTAKDIVIVYDYSVGCEKSAQAANTAGAPILSLLVVLDQPRNVAQRMVDLWNVRIHYVKEGALWLIDSIEYTKSPSRQVFHESQIIDNFAVVR